jgi:hypothetical protein
MTDSAPQFEEVKATHTPQYASVYANNAQVLTNFFDTSIVFGEMIGIQDGVLSVEQKVRVVLGLAQVKLLAMTLIQQLENYEKEFGTINIPTRIVPPELISFMKRASEASEANEGS